MPTHRRTLYEGVVFIAIFHCSIKVFSRGKGHSAVEKAAYRAGEKLLSDYNGRQYDYTKKGGVIYSEILLPEHVSKEYADRTTLWNAVEKAESSKNSQLAREIEVSLPAELSIEQNIALAKDYVHKYFVSVGMCADVCIHDKGDGNPHAHIMLTMRPIEANGHWGAKSKKVYILDENGDKFKLPSGEYKSKKVNSVDWNERTKAEEWRYAWADTVNLYLSNQGLNNKIDHRSYERQGIDKVPSIHMGVAASQMEKKGIATERGTINQNIADMNKEIRQVKARIKKQKTWLYSLPLTEALSLIDMMKGAAGGKRLKSNWETIKGIKLSGKILVFLKNNNISTIEELADKVTKMHEDIYEVSKQIKSVERRLDTVSQHLNQYEIYKEHKGLYQKYKELDPKKKEAFYDKYNEKLSFFEEAKSYFNSVMNGRKTLPLAEWQKEQKSLLNEKISLGEKFYNFKEDLKSVEALRRGTENLMRENVVDREKVNKIEIR